MILSIRYKEKACILVLVMAASPEQVQAGYLTVTT